jgi:hypothetical protein
MSENEMGYRGSKSSCLSYTEKQGVKEQRVDGSYFGKIPKLRCTLMGGESRYQIKILSNQLNRPLHILVKASECNKYYSSISYSTFFKFPLNPYFVTGFSDAEASFIVLISK